MSDEQEKPKSNEASEAKRFERCPRCLKTLSGYSIYHCPSCDTTFCSACNSDDYIPPDDRWLNAAAADLQNLQCPICTEKMGEEDCVGEIS